MIVTSKNNLGNLYSFIRASLVNEAKEEEKKIHLDYKVNSEVLFDAYFPNGLVALNTPFTPLYVLIFCGDTIRFRSWLHSINFDVVRNASVAIITNFLDNSLRNIPINYNFVNLYGKSFIDNMIAKHNLAFLNFLLGTKGIEIKVVNREKEEKTPHERFNNEIELYPSKGVKYIIHEHTPDLLSNENELLFRTFLDSKDEKEGNKCALVIGNGVSIPFGADKWDEMINHLLDYLEPFYIDDLDRVKSFLSDSSYAISSFVQTTLYDAKLKSQYDEALYYCVYRKVNELMFKEDTLAKVISQGKIKYPGLPLLTYNYDTFIEHQYTLDCGKHLRCILPDKTLSVPSDSIVHLHGYIDYRLHIANNIILTDKEYFDAYLDYPSKPTRSLQEKILKDHYCLFVGSSMSDLFQMSIISDLKKKDKKGKWSCFALMCFKDLSLNEKIHLIRYYRSKGVYLITVNSFADLPKKFASLLNIKPF